jgi:stage V sporulation protein R
MEYDRLAKGYGYGLSKIYEMVVNTDPVYAYLLDVNQVIDQKMVIAHVCGHAHFFKHNYMFGPTNRKMMDEMANHGNRIRRYMAKYGVETVENFIDCCLTIEDLIDMHAPFIKRASTHEPVHAAHEDDEGEDTPEPYQLPASGYMRDYINPPSFIQEQRERMRAERWHRRSFRRSRRKMFCSSC